jgi:nitrite reductase/ring-hydroxylating ferredoxin subunit
MAIQRRTLLGGAIALASLFFAGTPAFGNEVNLGRITQLKIGTAKLFSVASSRVLVIRRSARKFSAFIATCPSDKVRLTVSSVRAGRITCRGDNSVFASATGARISGPAKTGLKKVKIKITNGFLIATLAATQAQSPSAGQLIESAKVPVGGGVKVETSVGVLMIVQPTSGKFVAYSAICTHAGCEVSRATAKAIVCTCHNSEFSTADGARISGPATGALKNFRVVERNGMLFLA